MAIYHVAKNGTDDNVGTENQPFLTINHAAQIALPGDTVMVHQGVYREWVDPKNAGLNDRQRITYQAVAGDHVVLKGSEVVKDWQPVTKGIWKTVVDNKLFGDYNPFAVKLDGDWLEQGNDCHAGDLYVNHHSFYEAHSYEKMATADERKTVTDYVTGIRSADRHAARTKYRWFAEVSDQTTTIYANFHELDPKQALVEISVRKCCFYPRHTGINYVTLSGFEICQAATPWAPPTTEQIGMVGPHWAKGWQIKDNELHDAKCCAISIGCPKLGDDNAYNQRHDKPGYQYQLERIFNASRHGWAADTVGAHEIAHIQFIIVANAPLLVTWGVSSAGLLIIVFLKSEPNMSLVAGKLQLLNFMHPLIPRFLRTKLTTVFWAPGSIGKPRVPKLIETYIITTYGIY